MYHEAALVKVMKVKIPVVTTGFELWYRSFTKDSVVALFYSGILMSWSSRLGAGRKAYKLAVVNKVTAAISKEMKTGLYNSRRNRQIWPNLMSNAFHKDLFGHSKVNREDTQTLRYEGDYISLL
jgi:hypothetical protein